MNEAIHTAIAFLINPYLLFPFHSSYYPTSRYDAHYRHPCRHQISFSTCGGLPGVRELTSLPLWRSAKQCMRRSVD
jgi:hypothetical protein